MRLLVDARRVLGVVRLRVTSLECSLELGMKGGVRSLLVMREQTLLVGIMIACMSAAGVVGGSMVERRVRFGTVFGNVVMMRKALLFQTGRMLRMVGNMVPSNSPIPSAPIRTSACAGPGRHG